MFQTGVYLSTLIVEDFWVFFLIFVLFCNSVAQCYVLSDYYHVNWITRPVSWTAIDKITTQTKWTPMPIHYVITSIAETSTLIHDYHVFLLLSLLPIVIQERGWKRQVVRASYGCPRHLQRPKHSLSINAIFFCCGAGVWGGTEQRRIYLG